MLHRNVEHLRQSTVDATPFAVPPLFDLFGKYAVGGINKLGEMLSALTGGKVPWATMGMPNPDEVPKKSKDLMVAAKQETRNVPLPFHDIHPTAYDYVTRLEKNKAAEDDVATAPSPAGTPQAITPSLFDLAATKHCSVLSFVEATSSTSCKRKNVLQGGDPGNGIDNDDPAPTHPESQQ